MAKYNVGDTVSWESHANGHCTKKMGEVVAVVPPRRSAVKCCPKQYSPPKSCGKPRGKESYLVKVKDVRRLYWPMTGILCGEVKAVPPKPKAKNAEKVPKIPPLPPIPVFSGIDDVLFKDKPKFGEWTPCTKGYPRVSLSNGFWEFVTVVVYQGGKFNPICTARFTLSGGDRTDGGTNISPCFKTDDGIRLSRVTHWMPLPTPPPVVISETVETSSPRAGPEAEDELDEKSLEMLKDLVKDEDEVEVALSEDN